MKTPVYLMPFVYTYRIVRFITLFCVHFLKCFFIGVFTTIWTFSSVLFATVTNFVKYFLYGIIYISLLFYEGTGKFFRDFIYGFIVVSFGVFKFFKYFVYGTYYPFVIINDGIRKIEAKNAAKNEEKRNRKKLEKERKQNIERDKRLAREKALEKRVKDRVAKEEKIKADKKAAAEKRKKDREVFINENVKIEKQDFKSKLKQFKVVLKNLPISSKENLKKWYENLSFVKNKKNRYEMQHQELLISFEGEDAEKSAEKIPYEYVVKAPDGKIIKGHYEAFSKVEVHSFLLSEGYEVYSIKTSPWIKLLYGKSGKNNGKFKTKDLIFFLTQLSTYIKSGITLVESLKILSRQYKKRTYRQSIRNVIYELTMGESFSEAMSKQGNAFPRLLVNMIKTSEMTGELPETLDDMANYYTEADKTRKQMVTAMMYPLIILCISLVVIVFIMVYVVPQFTNIYASMDNAEVPEFTLMIVDLSDFLKANGIYLLIGLSLFLIIILYLYKSVKAVRTIIQWILMHIPVIKNVIIYNEVTMFTKTFASLLKHNVFITDSMEILNKVTNNEIYKMIILDTISNLAHGDKLSLAFQNHWAFPLPAYEMLVTGEKTGQLPEMMQKVSDYYQELHKNSVTRIKTFIEPILIVFLTVIVGIIILAVIVPMFNLYQNVQGA